MIAGPPRPNKAVKILEPVRGRAKLVERIRLQYSERAIVSEPTSPKDPNASKFPLWDRLEGLLKEWWRRKAKLQAVTGAGLALIGASSVGGVGQQIVGALLEKLGLSGSGEQSAWASLTLVGVGALLLLYNPKPRFRIKREVDRPGGKETLEIKATGLEPQQAEAIIKATIEQLERESEARK